MMPSYRGRVSVLVLVSIVLAGRAQNPAPLTGPMGVTRLVVGVSIAGIQPIVPVSNGPSRVRVPLYEQVSMEAPAGIWSSYQWTKNNVPIPGATSSVLNLPLATATDSGFYNVTGVLLPTVLTGSMGTGIHLDVTPTGNTSNFSSLTQLAPGGTQTIGFVVTGQTNTPLLLRVVGPSLRDFGIANPVASPRFAVFNSRGQSLSFVRVVTIGGPPIDWSSIFTSVGAFPLLATDAAYDLANFAPGAYTVRITDSSGQGGNVLFETYAVSGAAISAAAQLTPPL